MREKFIEIEKEINYFGMQTTFIKENGKELSWEEVEEMCEGDEIPPEVKYPYDIESCLNLNINPSVVQYTCSDTDEDAEEDTITFTFNFIDDDIAIKKEKFTYKDLYIILNMAKAINPIYIGLAKSNSDTFTKYAQESTAYQTWINDFFQIFEENKDNVKRINLLNVNNNITVIEFEIE